METARAVHRSNSTRRTGEVGHDPPALFFYLFAGICVASASW